MATTLLVHEWFETVGGAEKVVSEMWDILDKPEVFCLWDKRADRTFMNATESKLAGLADILPKSALLPSMLAVWRDAVITQDFDQVVVSSHLFAHQLRIHSPKTRKFVYVHSPARYLWAPEYDGRASGIIPKIVSPTLRLLDKKFSCIGATSVAANSEFIANRISSSWGIESTVVYPNVDCIPISESNLTEREIGNLDLLPQGFALSISRLVSYKRLDLAIQFSKGSGIPLVIAGQGPEEMALRELSTALGVQCIFLGRVSDAMLHALYRRALVLVFPGVEDFGITPVEAMSFGVPVLANTTGGTAETVKEGVGGYLSNFKEMPEVIEKAHLAIALDKAGISSSVHKFSGENFRENFKNWLGSND